MKCDNCGKIASNAVIFVQIINNEKNISRLCDECAEGKGIIRPIEENYLQTGIQISKVSQHIKETFRLSCPVCKLTYETFKIEGLLGCPECYNAFSEQLSELVLQRQDANEHIGKNPLKLQKKSISLQAEKDFSRLLESLRIAVENQEFERAAQLKDQIDQLKAKLQ